MEIFTHGMRLKAATACAWLTLAGNALLFVIRRLETVELDQHRLQVAVEHRLTAIETKLDLLLTQRGTKR